MPRRTLAYGGAAVVAALVAVEIVAHVCYAVVYRELHWASGTEHEATQQEPSRVLGMHPYVGTTDHQPRREGNAYPPHRGSSDTIVIGVFGSWGATDILTPLHEAVGAHLRAANLDKTPAILRLTTRNGHQPQQLMMAVNRIVLGGRFDIIVNLDGFNDAAWPFQGMYHGFPQVRSTTNSNAVGGLLGIDAALREQHRTLALAAESSVFRHSAAFGLVQRRRLDAVARALVENQQALAAADLRYDLERNGPHERDPSRAQQVIRAPRLWFRASALLAGIAPAAGADYYHFLQPNQHVRGSKPLSELEKIWAVAPEQAEDKPFVAMHPAFADFGVELRRAGVAFFDLTMAFADHQETLYSDEWGGLNPHGRRLLAEHIVRRIAPSLEAIGRRDGAPPPTPLDTGEDQLETLLVDSYDYDLILRQGKRLVYRGGCTKTQPTAFFLHVRPLHEEHLDGSATASRSENLDFDFQANRGTKIDELCTVEQRLPDYPIARLRTGGYDEETQRTLWTAAVDFRAVGTALPFKVFRRGVGVLIYKREGCTAKDMRHPFFLHALPATGALRQAAKRTHLADAWSITAEGYVQLDFARAHGEVLRDGVCVFEREVPFAFQRLRTGQYDAVSLERLWQRNIDRV